MNPQGHAALITGGGSGLGAATAEKLAAAGAKVALLDLNIEAAKSVAGRIGGIAIRCDVSDPQATEAAIKEAHERHGAARIVVNCAGIGEAKRIVGRDGPMPLPEFERTIRVNLIGTFNTLRLAATDMQSLPPLEAGERGVIIMTASVAAYEGQIGQAAYSASKGGVVALVLPAARELSQFGIRVTAIAPGIFRTPMLGALREDIQKSLAESVPFPKLLGDPGEYAALALHMVENRYLNGETVRLDGALRMAPR
jgi:NAD(P)-dependent dehydrogenase (short-subunit alcohol dehydrogenase family)